MLSASSSISWKCRSSFNTLSGFGGRINANILMVGASLTILTRMPQCQDVAMADGDPTCTKFKQRHSLLLLPGGGGGGGGDYTQNSALEAPELERWVTGYSNDSGTPQESTYLPGSVNMPLNPTMRRKKTITMVMRNDPTRKLFLLMNSFLLPSSSCPTFKIQFQTNLPCCAC